MVQTTGDTQEQEVYLRFCRKRKESVQSWKKFLGVINLYQDDGEYREGKKQLVS